ncbi:MAG: hypothetical protein WCI41_03565 [bacterium]
MKKNKNLVRFVEFTAFFLFGFFICYVYIPQNKFEPKKYDEYLKNTTYNDSVITNLAIEIIETITNKKPFVIANDTKLKSDNFSEQFDMQSNIRIYDIDINIAAFKGKKFPTIRIKSPIDEIGCHLLSKISGVENGYFSYMLDGKKPFSTVQGIEGKEYEFIRDPTPDELKEVKKRFYAYLLYIKDKLRYSK